MVREILKLNISLGYQFEQLFRHSTQLLTFIRS